MVAETRGLVQHIGHPPVPVDDAVAAAARASTTPEPCPTTRCIRIPGRASRARPLCAAAPRCERWHSVSRLGPNWQTRLPGHRYAGVPIRRFHAGRRDRRHAAGEPPVPGAGAAGWRHHRHGAGHFARRDKPIAELTVRVTPGDDVVALLVRTAMRKSSTASRQTAADASASAQRAIHLRRDRPTESAARRSGSMASMAPPERSRA